jgi:hypothetical protein
MVKNIIKKMFSPQKHHIPIHAQIPLYFFITCATGLILWYCYLNHTLFPVSEKKLQKIMLSTETAINSYLKTAEKNARTLAEQPQIKNFLNALITKTATDKDTKEFDSFILSQEESMDFKDIILIDSDKIIRFASTSKNIINEKLKHNEHKNCFLVLSYERAMMSLTPDFSEYGYDPLFGKPTLFVNVPIIHSKKFIGILSYECNMEKIITLTKQYKGLGETGEIVLAQESNSFILFIAPSRHDKDLAFKRKKLFSKNPPAIQKSILGEQGIGAVIDYRDQPVVGAWTFIPKVNWGMIVKMDQIEVQQPLYLILKLLLLCIICIFIYMCFIEYFYNAPCTHFFYSLEKKSFIKRIPAPLKNIFFLALLMFLFLLCKTIISYIHTSNTIIAEEKQDIIQDITIASEEINQILKKISFAAQSIADDLRSNRLSHDDITKRLKRDLIENDTILGITIAFAPFKYNAQTKLFAPSMYKADQPYQQIMTESLYDYTHPDPNNNTTAWYRKALQSTHVWLNPYKNNEGKLMPPSYSIPFLNNNKEIQGVICITYNLAPIERITGYSSLDRKGYSILLSENGTFLSHPITSLVRSEKTLLELAQENGSQTLIEIAQTIASHRKILSTYHAEEDHQIMWMYAEPIPINNWTLAAIFSKDDISLPSDIIRQHYFWILIYCILSIACACAYLFSIEKISMILFVIISNILLSFGLISSWRIIQKTSYTQTINSTIITDQASLDKFIDDLQEEAIRKQEEPPIQIPCGLLLYSLDMPQPDHMTISGYIWNKYHITEHKDITHQIQLPHAILLTIDNPISSINNKWETVTWNIRGNIYEKQSYTHFPFDKQQMQITIEHHDIEKNIILTPDLEDYKKTSPEETPGLDKNFTLSEFNVETTFFMYKKINPVTNFGFSQYGKTTDHFQLIYNLIITRSLLGPFILYFLPLLVVLFSLFAVLLIAKRKSEPINIITPYTGLFFALILLHRSLREHYYTGATLYMEYGFFFTYITIILLVIHAVLLFLYPSWNYYQYKIFHFAKLLFWPLQLASWLITTFIIFY